MMSNKSAVARLPRKVLVALLVIRTVVVMSTKMFPGNKKQHSE